ncbi:MAG: hypothetical protein IT379_34690 [Deltaproteobacteria bacterium]|nr:hypothetical protein [Deltaproteobacteria bacterium]
MQRLTNVGRWDQIRRRHPDAWVLVRDLGESLVEIVCSSRDGADFDRHAHEVLATCPGSYRIAFTGLEPRVDGPVLAVLDGGR